jgi:Peptidase family M28/PA domain
MIYIRLHLLFAFVFFAQFAVAQSEMTQPAKQPSTQVQNDSIDPALLRRAPKPKRFEAPDPKPYGDLITATEMDQMIVALASDSMGGRETGTEGQRIAARYIAHHFDTLGMQKKADANTFYQNFKLENEKWKQLEVVLAGEDRRNLRDYFIFPSEAPSTLSLNKDEMIYVGYGIDDKRYTDYKKSKVKGKIVIVEGGEPEPINDIYPVTGTAFKSDWSIKHFDKAKAAADNGAKAMIYIDPKFEERVKQNRTELAGYAWRATLSKRVSAIPIIYISRKMADALLSGVDLTEKQAAMKAGQSAKAVKVAKSAKIAWSKELRTLEGSNVLGYLEGADEMLKEELVVITAHYDHLGLHNNLIHTGADDNASGTAGVMEMAESFMAAARAGIRPKRSVLFMLVSGEEKGLLGSEFYTNFPVFPLKNTVCNINTDMIGRLDAAHAGDPNYIYVIGADRLSSELHAINEDMNERYTKIKLDYTYNAPDDPNHYYERSDHYNFAKNGIPSIFYFNGVHVDYHKATDTADKINAEAATVRTQLAFYTAWEIAHRPARLVVDKKG